MSVVRAPASVLVRILPHIVTVYSSEIRSVVVAINSLESWLRRVITAINRGAASVGTTDGAPDHTEKEKFSPWLPNRYPQAPSRTTSNWA